MKYPDLIESCIDSQEIENTRFMRVRRDRVRLPSGNEGEREYIMHPGAVLVIPMLDDGKLVLERQFRYPLRQVFIELPAGKIDPDEDPLITGQRDEVIHIYLARGLQSGQHQRDADEALQVFEAGLDDCLSMVQRGEITDGKTIIALFWLEKYLQGLWPA